MIHPDTRMVEISPEIGLGVRCTRPIPRGTILWALDRLDLVLAPAQVAALPPLLARPLARYGYRDARGRRVLCWDGGRYVNHSCVPAMRGVGGDVQIAVRDLEVGDEVTCDYAECNIDAPLECRCGAASCRGLIRGDDLLRHHAAWDAEVRAALGPAALVEQPLLPVLLDPDWFRAVLRGAIEPPSLRAVRCPA